MKLPGPRGSRGRPGENPRAVEIGSRAAHMAFRLSRTCSGNCACALQSNGTPLPAVPQGREAARRASGKVGHEGSLASSWAKNPLRHCHLRIFSQGTCELHLHLTCTGLTTVPANSRVDSPDVDSILLVDHHPAFSIAQVNPYGGPIRGDLVAPPILC
jgi:hypothetical protein